MKSTTSTTEAANRRGQRQPACQAGVPWQHSWTKPPTRNPPRPDLRRKPRGGDHLGPWIRAGRQVLLMAARQGSVVSFGDFVDRVEARSGVQGVGYPLWMHTTLERIADACIKNGEPILSALCVSTDGTVTNGYARSLKKHGYTNVDLERHASRERQRCYSYSAPKPKPTQKPKPTNRRPTTTKTCPGLARSPCW